MAPIRSGASSSGMKLNRFLICKPERGYSRDTIQSTPNGFEWRLTRSWRVDDLRLVSTCLKYVTGTPAADLKLAGSIILKSESYSKVMQLKNLYIDEAYRRNQL